MRQDDSTVHTPTPWHVDENGDVMDAEEYGVAYVSYQAKGTMMANADLIVRAVNGFYVMRDALRFIAAGHGCPSALAEDALKQAGLSND